MRVALLGPRIKRSLYGNRFVKIILIPGRQSNEFLSNQKYLSYILKGKILVYHYCSQDVNYSKYIKITFCLNRKTISSENDEILKSNSYILQFLKKKSIIFHQINISQYHYTIVRKNNSYVLNSSRNKYVSNQHKILL